MQQDLFKEQPTKEYQAYSYLWEFFFHEHNLMLLNEQIDEITKAVDKFKEIHNGKKENNTSGEHTLY